MITTINTVALYVTDQERSKQFYADVLGFEVRTDSDMGEMGRWLEVAPPGSSTAFVLADAAAFDKQEQVGLSADVTMRCDDAHRLHQELAAHGVTVTEPEKQTWGTFFRFTDPDGHIFIVSS